MPLFKQELQHYLTGAIYLHVGDEITDDSEFQSFEEPADHGFIFVDWIYNRLPTQEDEKEQEKI